MIIINIELPLGLILIFNVDMKQWGAILMAQQGFIVNIPHMKKASQGIVFMLYYV